MAVLFPRRIDPACQSSAEKKLFERLQREPGTEEWEVLHSLAFPPEPSGRSGPLRLESDFVVVSPAGVVFVEVKGGRVRLDDSGDWIFTDRFGRENRKPKSPFKQAADARYHFEGRIREAARPYLEGNERSLPIGYAVLFPDVEVANDANLGGESRDLLGDKRELRASAGIPGLVSRWIGHVASRQTGGVRLSAQAIKVIRETLWGDFDFVPGLETVLEETRSSIRGFTAEQVGILEAMDQESRLYVTGGAGTGKTMLAIQGAARFAHAGRRVALMCYNRNLSGMLRAKIEEIQARNEGLEIEVIRSEQFLNRAMEATGLKQDWHGGAAKESGRREEMILEAATEVPQLWDCIVIDEGQDVLEAGMDLLLDNALKGGIEQGEWRVFLDRESQGGVYGKDHSGAVGSFTRCGRHLPLTRNCRNAAEVIKGARAITSSELNEGRVEGGECRFKEHAGEAAPAVVRIVRELIGQGSKASSITALGCRKGDAAGIMAALDASDLAAERLDGDSIAERFSRGALDAVTVATVSAFKGLENDIVVLCGLEGLESLPPDRKKWGEAIRYVGSTRSRSQLHVVAPKGLSKRLREAMRRATEAASPTVDLEVDLL
ncbi:NERD domain-containing protein [bacterium]|nr:NERD domain-containing protein [bacterium]